MALRPAEPISTADLLKHYGIIGGDTVSGSRSVASVEGFHSDLAVYSSSNVSCTSSKKVSVPDHGDF